MELKNNEKEIIFKDKYSMSLKENIFVAKRNLIDYIWKSANLEGIAVTYPLYDGNAMMAANQIMIQNGKGIISIPIEQQVTFREMLIDFYETDNMYRIKNFLYNNCIDGINF